MSMWRSPAQKEATIANARQRGMIRDEPQNEPSASCGWAARATQPVSGGAVPDQDSEPADAFTGPEKLLHRDFATDMCRRGVHLVHARTDMASTIGLGTPDFHCLFTAADGICRGAACEFKRAGGALSARQRLMIDEMRRQNIPVIVAFTLASAIHFMRRHLLC